jgi:hypothetical protein
MKKAALTISRIIAEAKDFAITESQHREKSLFGITDGKAIGTYLEHKFQDLLSRKYTYIRGSSASGIDFPELGVDIKTTNITQPQSSCPFKSARQKVYGLGYHLLVFVYEKTDDDKTKAATLNILHVIFVESQHTADFQTTSGLLQILDNQGNKDDVVAFLNDRNLPLDTLQASQLADEILASRPRPGYLTISNALQWRLQYSRAIEKAGTVKGVIRVK